jgi:catechol 2,3-dioxygenase-like lactoylglutathione lyase family enzyme
MLTRIDHVVIGVPELERGIQAYRRLGFNVGAEGFALNDDDYLQLAAAPKEGVQSIALRSDAAAEKLDLHGLPIVIAGARRAGSPTPHPNGALRIERVYVAVADVAAAAKAYSAALRLPAPKMERGTVIMADMAVFQLGPTGLTLAQPCGPGVAADALARRGPGPFQVLLRTSGMDAASRWMAEQGLPPPARGIRNTGEHAMLVPPEQACGVYIGFVGPA